jgi:hypothetical protein
MLDILLLGSGPRLVGDFPEWIGFTREEPATADQAIVSAGLDWNSPSKLKGTPKTVSR